VSKRSGRPSSITRALALVARAPGPGLGVAHRLERRRPHGWRAAARRRAAEVGLEPGLKRNDAEAYRRIWCDAAGALGAKIEDLGEGFMVIRQGETETLVRRNTTMIDHPASIALALDKTVMHRILQGHGVPVPAHVEAQRSDWRRAAERIAAEGGRWVVKPASDTGGGYGVTCGVETTDDLVRAWLWAAVWNDRIVVERQADGEEYRLLFLDGVLLDAVHRSLPTVRGDGRSTVAALVEAENRRRLEAGPDEVGRAVKVDLDCELALRRQGLTVRSVPDDGAVVVVKGNVGDNAAADNTTEGALAPALVDAARRAAHLARLRFAGVDVVTPDPAVALQDGGSVVLEVNGTPGLQHHYLVRDRDRVTPVARLVLEKILAEARPGPAA